jgi:hypothetical protein
LKDLKKSKTTIEKAFQLLVKSYGENLDITAIETVHDDAKLIERYDHYSGRLKCVNQTI